MTLLEETKDEYTKTCEAYRSLVGTLYPSIVYEDILQLYDAYIKNGGKAEDLPSTPNPPTRWGRAG